MQTENVSHEDNRQEDAAEFTHYVHLSDGTVERVKAEDIPTYVGSNAPHGHFERDGKLYVVTGVYPRESEVEKKK